VKDAAMSAATAKREILIMVRARAEEVLQDTQKAAEAARFLNQAASIGRARTTPANSL
jgi:hypothetical protein